MGQEIGANDAELAFFRLPQQAIAREMKIASSNPRQ